MAEQLYSTIMISFISLEVGGVCRDVFGSLHYHDRIRIGHVENSFTITIYLRYHYTQLPTIHTRQLLLLPKVNNTSSSNDDTSTD